MKQKIDHVKMKEKNIKSKEMDVVHIVDFIHCGFSCRKFSQTKWAYGVCLRVCLHHTHTQISHSQLFFIVQSGANIMWIF